MIKAIASDLDGTFLGADGLPSERNLAAVRRAAEVGVRTIFATGRPYRWLDVLRPVLDADPLVLASNGAVRYDLHRHEVISADLIDPEAALEVVADIRASDPKLMLLLELLEGYAADESFPIKDDREHPRVQLSVEEALEKASPVKLMVLAPHLDTNALAAEISPLIGERMTPTWSYVTEAGLVEISRAGVSKGSGLATLLEELSISPSEVAAFGDMPNDLPMLHLVGHPFRMTEAHPLLHEAGFPEAGDHGDSGVGRTVERLLADVW